MPRLAPLDLNKLTPEQKKVADAIVAGPRGGLRGPFEPWLRRPELADRAQKLGEYCRFNNSLPQRPLASWRSAWSAGTSRRSTSSTPMPASPRKPASRPRSSRRCAPRQTPPFTRDVERIVYDFVTEYLDDQPRLGAQLQARHRCLRRAGRGRSGGRVRLLHAGVDDAQRLRDAAAAGRARAARLSRTRGLPPLPGGRLRSSRCRRDPASSTSPHARSPTAAAQGLASSLGTALGGLVHVAAGAVGVSALIMASAEAFTAAEARGRALSGLARHQDRARGAHRPAVATRRASAARRAFRDGIVVEALNPKTAAFFLAFLPQFVDPPRTGLAAVPRARPDLGAR